MVHQRVLDPQKYARIGGVLYLVIIITGIFAEMFVRDALIVPGNAAATAENIKSSEFLWRIGFSGQIIMLVCDVVVSYILYMLLKAYDKNLALLAVIFRLVSISIMGINSLNHFAVLFILNGPDYLSVFSSEQLAALAFIFLRSHSHGYNITLVFFGFHCLFLGYILYKSDLLPRFIGILLLICGLCYITNSFAWFLDPSAASSLYPLILVPCFIAELALCVWLIVRGINIER